MSSKCGTAGIATSSIREVLLALRCQLEANDEPEPTITETTGVQDLSSLPPDTLLRRLLKVFHAYSSGSNASATDAAAAFQQQQGWQTLLALLSSTSATTTPTSPTGPQLAAEVAEALEWVVAHGQGWPTFVPWRLVQMAVGPGSKPGTRQASWRVLAAAAGNKELLHTLNAAVAPMTTPSPAAAVAAGCHGADASMQSAQQVSSSAVAGSSDVTAGSTTTTITTTSGSSTNSSVQGGRGGGTCLSQLLQALDQETYRQHLTPEAVQHVALMVLRCATSRVATSWPCHPAQLLLQLHTSLVNPQDLPPGCHCPAAAAAAAGGGAGDRGGEHQPNEGYSRPNMAACVCAACDAALQLLVAARQAVLSSTGAAAQPSGTTTAAHGTSNTNHSSSRRVQGAGSDAFDLLGLTKGVVHLVKELVRAAPRRLAAKLSWEGTTTSYEQRPAAAGPCSTLNTCSGPWQALLQVCGQPGGLNGGQEQLEEMEVPGTHLEAALQLLVSCCQALAPAQKKSLYMSTDIGGLLESLGDYTTPGCVLLLTQQLYGCLCQGFAGLRQEVLTAGSIPALCGMVCHSSAPGVRLAALEKLPQVLDSCSGQHFLMVCQPGGMVSWVTQLLAGKQGDGPGLAASGQVSKLGGCSPSTGAGSQPHGCSSSTTTMTSSSRNGGGGGSSSSSGGGGGGGGGGDMAREPPLQSSPLLHHTDALLMAQVLRAAAQVYCSLLDRARRMRPDGSASVTTLHLPAHQLLGNRAQEANVASANSASGAGGLVTVCVPRWGSWRQLAPSQTLALEHVALRLLRGPPSPLGAAGEDQGAQQAAGGHQANSSFAAAAAAAAAGGSGGRGDTLQLHQGSKRAVKEVRCLPGGTAAAAAGSTLDEDGLRVVWDSGPSPAVRAVRSTWSALPLRERITWSQTLQDVEVRLTLPPGTTKRHLAVNVQRERLTIKLTWCGRVVDGPLYRAVAYSSSCWSLDTVPMPKTASHNPQTSGSSSEGAGVSLEPTCQQKAPGSGGKGQAGGGAGKDVEWSELLLVLPKEEAGHYWKTLFEGGEEKSYWEILTEAVQCEEDAAQGPSLDQMGPEAAVLWEDLQERAAMVASGELDLQHGFDDFRIVIGDNTL